MLCIPIIGPSYEMAREQIVQASAYSDIYEFRLDLFHSINPEQLAKLNGLSKPAKVIYTLRPASQGGKFSESEESRLSTLEQLAELKPDYIDIEFGTPNSIISKIRDKNPALNIILSYHNFEHTPLDLPTIYCKMQKTPADIYKLATMATSSLDTLRMLNFIKGVKEKNVTAMAMGDLGSTSRILGKIYGNCFTYASLSQSQETAPGQIDAETLQETYRYHSLNSSTSVYGLIGDPVSKSISNVTHNTVMKELGLDAVYIKMLVEPHEVEDFFILAKKLGWQGLSVTMPLKENIMPFMNHIDPVGQKTGAVNTVLFEKNELFGYNTDGLGALDAIQKHMDVRGKKIIIVGAGGAAKAIVYEACHRGAIVIIINRDATKARGLANTYSCSGADLEYMQQAYDEGYDVLINCTPNPMPVDEKYLIPEAIVMDITTRPKYTTLLLEAQDRGCQIIFGYKMFVNQAVAQFRIWFKDKIHPDAVQEILLRVAEKIL